MAMVEHDKSTEIDTIAYAVSYSEAAGLVARSTDWENNQGMIVPFFGLIGFALENGLKAVLEYRSVDRSLKWFHSHDLNQLRDLTRKEGLWLLPNMDALIEHLAPYHVEHHFRYPQKARTAELAMPPTVVAVTDGTLRMIFDFIDARGGIEAWKQRKEALRPND
jgi:hypothetical protein